MPTVYTRVLSVIVGWLVGWFIRKNSTFNLLFNSAKTITRYDSKRDRITPSFEQIILDTNCTSKRQGILAEVWNAEYTAGVHQ